MTERLHRYLECGRNGMKQIDIADVICQKWNLLSIQKNHVFSYKAEWKYLRQTLTSYWYKKQPFHWNHTCKLALEFSLYAILFTLCTNHTIRPDTNAHLIISYCHIAFAPRCYCLRYTNLLPIKQTKRELRKKKCEEFTTKCLHWQRQRNIQKMTRQT